MATAVMMVMAMKEEMGWLTRTLQQQRKRRRRRGGRLNGDQASQTKPDFKNGESPKCIAQRYMSSLVVAWSRELIECRSPSRSIRSTSLSRVDYVVSSARQSRGAAPQNKFGP